MEFEDLFLWLVEQPYGKVIVALLSVISCVVVMIVQLKKYKIQSNIAKENNLKYRTEDYQKSTKGYLPPAQSFKRIVPVYQLDERTNNLVVVGTKDLQELIQSSRDCGLDVVLEKFGVLPTPELPKVDHETNEPFDATDIRDDLAYLADLADAMEDMRVRYNLPMASYAELQEHISKLKSDNDKFIEQQLSKQVKKEDNNG